MEIYFVMTVDVDPPFSRRQSHVIDDGVTRLLNIFRRHAINATFFVPAIVALNFPKVVEKIVEERHELGCHGFSHSISEATLSIDKKIQNIKDATRVLESIAGHRPLGFRAPFFKADRNCWIALSKNKYMYDSSCLASPLYMYEVKKPISGRPFYIRLNVRDNDVYNLIEIPVSVNPVIPFPLGGGWLRVFGLTWAKIGVKMNFTFKTPTVFYIHPKDVVPYEAYGLPWYYYRNNANALSMLSKIIQFAKRNEAKFLTARELAKKFEQNLM